MKVSVGDRMKSTFTYGSSFMNFLENITNVLLLNFWMLLTALPLITIPAALMGANATMARVLANQEAHVTRDYFRFFRQNLKQGLKLGVFTAAAAAVIAFDLRYLDKLPITLHLLLGNTLLVIAVATAILLSLLPSYLSRYEETIPHALRNLFIIFLHHAGWSLLMVLVTIWPLFLLQAGAIGVWTLVYWFSFVGFGVCAWLQTLIFRHIVSLIEA
ncbi:DUF624 domain-containing protein [Lacticaseibacillus jixianensis]|uniref:DUF624 domain-containing protein n=1 Tax=Lacticaseibacillus jixianensis TaxID=2486012 RepID=A0ABW4BDK9_9LACO|nr:DUF624 domain-containing protein [Lacticaseibacillus jixianensis]